IGKINRQSIVTSNFTAILQRYEDMPAELYVAGKLPNKRITSVAIVGSRKPTSYGEEVTYRFAYDLARQGVVIISGLAYGIDAIAHQAALDAGGITIAVMANGLHRIYPFQHTSLAEKIVQQGGALISEQALGIEAHPHHFLARNRIVSGLADAVLVTEATDRSGTFSTVAHALTQNKEVFAVPGPITGLLSAGPNRLLQDGAQVALSAEDILSVITPHHIPEQRILPLGDTPLEVCIIELLQKGIRDGDMLLAKSGASSSEFLSTLTMMELKGIIQANGGQWHLR
ncbi:MAG TPA: DNA-processing protein DprA, partial [Nitrospira sp.]|nr:DNA-processing protein DprA [Nitrospira sp.]